MNLAFPSGICEEGIAHTAIGVPSPVIFNIPSDDAYKTSYKLYFYVLNVFLKYTFALSYATHVSSWLKFE